MKFTIETKALLSALNTVGVFIRGKGKHIEVSCGDRSRINVMGAELAGQPAITLSVNHRYLRESLSVLDQENARIECPKDTRSLLIREGDFSAVIGLLDPQ